MKTVFITWHYPTVGVSFLKNVLAYFYRQEKLPDPIEVTGLNQEELNEVFNNPQENGFKFDAIYYLTTSQNVIDELTRGRAKNRKNILYDELIQNAELSKIFFEILDNQHIMQDYKQMIKYVRDHYDVEHFIAFKDLLWRDIHNLSVEQQIDWLLNESNFTRVYPKEKFKEVRLDIKSLRNEKEIAEKITEWYKECKELKDKSIQPIINVALCSSETQVVWHILTETQLLPENTRLIKTYDERSSGSQKRFKNLGIKEIERKIISSITEQIKIYPVTQSESRKLVDKKLEAFIKSGFSILLIGERGIGKSQMVKSVKERLKQNITIGNLVEANCASFDDDSKAESELFGYVKGAFTGADKDKVGLFKEAENGILFLDEIHHLSKMVQAKLMKAIQTDKNNTMHIRPLGSTKEVPIKNCRLIFATNKTIEELQQILLPDFYDRIVQHVIEIPPLRKTKEDIEKDWESVWKQLKFGNNVPKEKPLLDWLKTLPLYGNYRDLQKIAMYYHVYQEFDDDTKKMIPEKNAFEYAKSQFEKYHSPYTIKDKCFNFSVKKTTEQMITEYKYELQAWAIETFGGRKKAVEHFKKLGEDISEKTLNNWKNKVSQKNKEYK